MAYQLLDTNLLQSAIKAASQVTAALITTGDADAVADPQAVMDSISKDLFAQLKEKAEKDNEQLKADDRPAPGGGGGNWKRGGGGGNRDIKVTDDGSLKLTWGKFKGLTIAQVFELDESQAEEYGYQKSGAAWLEWVAKNKEPKVAPVAKNAQAFLEAKRS